MVLIKPNPPAAHKESQLPLASKGKDDQQIDSKGNSGFTVPALQFQVRDLKHAGAERFLGAVNVTECMTTAIHNLLKLLYNSPSDPSTNVPPTTSVTLILEDMPGVAYTIGHSDDHHVKEIHFSLKYIAGIASTRIGEEIAGVVTHELVHCFQHNALGTAPGGLIEGIADWVRLNCSLAPPHWKKEAGGKWDAGYQHTAFFLDYLENRFGTGTVRRINEKLRTTEYDEDKFWKQILGRKVNELYKDYTATFKKQD
ncbi:hypothetical protein PT974_01068 [Cladobotryum mycophilum]|uniref:Uncharacterized protein n=1 Tax=Cladobotryum mycophilum TaxID=491253 RepID=A0ABR0T431_9HYPO